MASVLITGSSRGLGLELIKQITSDTSVGLIIATSRGLSPSPALAALISQSNGKINYVQLDTDDTDSISAAAHKVDDILGDKGLDVLINNAGIQLYEKGGVTAMTALEKTLNTNVVGVYKVSAALIPLLKKGNQKKLINVTSTLGSIALIKNFAQSPTPSYKVSKSALNMLTAQTALELGKEGFIVFAISPGWLKTDLGSQRADLEPEVGAKEVWRIISEATTKDNGAFKDIYVPGHPTYPGTNPPW